MICLTLEDANNFKKEFNAKNNQDSVPDWYMAVIHDPEPINITKSQMNYLKKEKSLVINVKRYKINERI